jgi:hypothetical protein
MSLKRMPKSGGLKRRTGELKVGYHGSYLLQKCLNIRRKSSLSENVCPRVLFTGIKVDCKKELNLIMWKRMVLITHQQPGVLLALPCILIATLLVSGHSES